MLRGEPRGSTPLGDGRKRRDGQGAGGMDWWSEMRIGLGWQGCWKGKLRRGETGPGMGGRRWPEDGKGQEWAVGDVSGQLEMLDGCGESGGREEGWEEAVERRGQKGRWERKGGAGKAEGLARWPVIWRCSVKGDRRCRTWNVSGVGDDESGRRIELVVGVVYVWGLERKGEKREEEGGGRMESEGGRWRADRDDIRRRRTYCNAEEGGHHGWVGGWMSK
ncbi:hypothetical protein PYCCODRAFT_648952 [Trametes coccinea BRFM310]|uniref:Uncharacterized protein n=1 Tax=Trametes coccinea (strain BRFM310) TaxID=1353009 RepID=A0A1Y2II92_TRAC3|nr:hypothetical protein PYCCODRAFT_648952 [Trametes coccinea BRFM310]